ncbi:MAG: hypothetical protein GX359_06090, partial [Clostridiales bacterium]|nr:hypothetical protein [Clostridiales bacterium]
MAKEIEGQTLREYGNRRKRYRRIRNTIIGMLLVAIIVVVGIYLYLLYNKDYQSYEVISSQAVTGASGNGYLIYNGG